MRHYRCPCCHQTSELWSHPDYLRGWIKALEGMRYDLSALTILAIEATLEAE